MEDDKAVFEEELVQCGVANAFKFFQNKGYGLRARRRACVSEASKVKLLVEDNEGELNDRAIKERYKDMSRVFHGSKPLSKKSSSGSAKKKPKLSFEVKAERKIEERPKTRLFGFT